MAPSHDSPSGLGGNSPTASLDGTFASHSLRAFAHIVPAVIFVLLVVIVLLRAKQNRWAQITG